MKLRFYGGLISAVVVLLACNMSFNSTQVTPTPSFEGVPTIRIASPLADAVYYEGTDVNILARVENAGPDIARVAIKLNDTTLSEMDGTGIGGMPDFGIVTAWDGMITGEHTISVIVTRNTGESASEQVNIEVRPLEVAGADDETPVEATEAIVEVTTTEDPEPVTTEDPEPAVTQEAVAAETEEEKSVTQLSLPSPVPVDTATPAPSSTPLPTATFTPEKLMVRVTNPEGANVRSGPGINFPTVGTGYAAGAETDLLAVNPQGTWYRIRYYNSSDTWISGTVVETMGDISKLPVEVGPPTPIPVTNTPVATNTPVPTNTPTTQVNLIVESVGTAPHPLVCNQSSTVTIVVKNAGTANATSGGKVLVEALRKSDNQVIGKTETIFGNLNAGATQSVEAYLTVNTYIGEGQFIRVTVDSANQIAESNESDNSRNDGEYVLQSGGC